MPKKIISPIIVVLLFMTCESINESGASNPLDPDNPDFIDPQIIIKTGPTENDTLTLHTAVFSIQYNETAREFSYNLNQAGWSTWSSDTILTLTYLDEGEHELGLKTRNIAGIEGSLIITRYFSVNAITGPALWFKPRKVTVSNGEQFTIEICLEEVENIAGISIEIPIDNRTLELISASMYEGDQSFLGQGASVIGITDTTHADSVLKFNEYRVGSPSVVSGSGSIGSLTFQFIGAAHSQIEYSANCTAIDSIMNPVNLDVLIPMVIEYY